MSKEQFLSNYGHIYFDFDSMVDGQAIFALQSGAWFSFEIDSNFSNQECPDDWADKFTSYGD